MSRYRCMLRIPLRTHHQYHGSSVWITADPPHVEGTAMTSITPCLLFAEGAEDAVNLYVSLIPNSAITEVTRYGEGAPLPAGTVLTIEFVLDGLGILVINGGGGAKFTDAMSLSVSAETQDEIDKLWNGLIDGGGAPGRCGWLTDRFGVSWQVVPPRLNDLLKDPDPARAGRAMQAMLTMTKIDIAQLEAAAAA
jgi:predicted 3-demethylubiquinone-9 3-methyltransferase (glyoxalase superfamily)